MWLTLNRDTHSLRQANSRTQAKEYRKYQPDPLMWLTLSRDSGKQIRGCTNCKKLCLQNAVTNNTYMTHLFVKHKNSNPKLIPAAQVVRAIAFFLPISNNSTIIHIVPEQCNNHDWLEYRGRVHLETQQRWPP